MEKELADGFLEFYKKMLKPEFDAIRTKQAEHDERFLEVLGHLESMYDRVGKLEAERENLQARLDSAERKLSQ